MKRELVVIDIAGTVSAKALLKSEMAKREISRQQLVDLLLKSGVNITKASIDNRLSRGTFSADFFLECLRAMGCHDVGIAK